MVAVMPPSARLPVAGLGLGLFVLQLWHALARLSSIHHATFDLAMYSRLAWGIAGGDGWLPILDTHFIAAHASVALLPLGLLGRLLGTPEVLLTAQAACLAAVVWPLSRIGGRRFGAPGAVAAALLWALYPNLGHVAAYEFHPGSLAMLPLAFGLDALDRRDGRALGWSVVGVLACRADFALMTAVIGVVALRQDALVGVGRRIAVGSAAYFALVALLAPRLFEGGVTSASLHFGHWGGSPLGVIPALLTRPGDVLEHFAQTLRLLYPLKVLAPLLLLPLLRPWLLLIALPPLALNLLSAFPTTVHLYSHYLTPAIAPLIYAALDGAAGASLRLRTGLLWGAVMCAGAGSIAAGGYPWSRDYPASAFVPDAATADRAAVLAAIPDGASVQAPDPLLPHLSERRVVHRAPPPERGTEFVVLDVAHRQRFGGTATLLRTQQEPQVQRWLARADHGVVQVSDSLLLLRRGGDPRAGVAARYFTGGAAGPDRGAGSGAVLTDCLAVTGATLEGAALELRLRARGGCPADLAIRLGSAERPEHVQLLFDGVLSPVHLRAGDTLRSTHTLPPEVSATIARGGLRIGALRTSGAPPNKHDPPSVAVTLH